MKPGLILHTQKGVVLLLLSTFHFLPCHQVKLLESLESMDKDSFNMKFGGVLTYTTVGRTKKAQILIQIFDSGILTDWPTD